MTRGVIIKFDPDTMEWGYEPVGVGSTGFNSFERTAKEKYGNQLYNGKMEIELPNGDVTVYEDGVHLIERPDAGGVIQAMSKPEYAQFTGRPGSENEA